MGWGNRTQTTHGEEKRGKRIQGGLKSDLAQQYNWGQTRND